MMSGNCAQLTDEDGEDEEGIRYGGKVGYWGRMVAGLFGREGRYWYCVSVTEE